MKLMDLRLALRSCRRRPVLLSAVVLAIALAVAITTSLFSVLDGLLFRPLPFNAPDALATVDFRRVGGKLPVLMYMPELADRRNELRERVIRSPLVAAASQADFVGFFDPVDARELGLRVQGVDSQFFPLFGLSPVLGTNFSREDEWVSASWSSRSPEPLPIIIGHTLWQRFFAADPDILGVRTLAGRSVRIVGVMGSGVKFPDETNVWAVERSTRGWPPTYIRLAPGASVTQLAGIFPELRFRTLREVLHPGEGGALPMLFGAAVLLLLVTWVQVAALMLSGALEQLRDLGVRLALGAGRGRLLRQFAVQGAVLAGAASGLAWLLVRPLTGFVISILPEELSRGKYLAPDLRALLFGSLISLLGLVLITLLPFGLLGRATPLNLLHRRVVDRSFRVERVRQALLVVQITLTALLLYVAGLGLRTFVEATRFDYGFDAQHVIVFTFPRTLGDGRTPERAAADFQEDKRKVQVSVERLQRLPGVISASSFFSAPLGIGNQPGLVSITPLDGYPFYGAETTRVNSVGVDFVGALGAMMIAGHGFDDPGYASRDDIIIVNETLARQLSPPIAVMGQDLGPSVLGRRIRTPNGPGEIIGVIKDFIDTKLDLPTDPQLFMPDRRSLAAAAVFVRVNSPVEVALPTVQAALEGIWGPLLPRHFTFMRDEMRAVLAPYRGQSILLGLIVACCLPIAALGLVGALTYSVRVRTREIAIQMALGADPNVVRRSVTRNALRIVALGALLGVGLGAAIGRLISHRLFNVNAVDVPTIVAVLAGLLLLAWLAAAVPSRQASRVSPAEALREV